MTQETYTQGHHESVLRSHTSRNVANSDGYLTGELRPASRLVTPCESHSSILLVGSSMAAS